MATATAGETFVEQVLKEIILPARDQLLDNRYFTDLRNGKLTKRRLQGFSLEHTWFNWVLLKGTALRMLSAPNVSALRGNTFGNAACPLDEFAPRSAQRLDQAGLDVRARPAFALVYGVVIR